MTVASIVPAQTERTTGWVDLMVPVAQLANEIKSTDLVPKWLRGNVPAICGVVLFGYELGLPPMTALRTVYMVDGMPSLKAEAMRALVLARGHEIVYDESTASEATVRGRRRGQDTWHSVTWTRDDARRAGLGSANGSPWQKYPRAMLKARATAELCRDLFPDVVGGFSAVEESDDLAVPIEAEAPPLPRARVRRRQQPPAVEAPPGDGGGGPPPEPPPAGEPPPSGDTSGGPADDLEAAVQVVQEGLGPVTPVPPEQVASMPQNPSTALPWTDDQRRAVMVRFQELGVSERPDRLALTGSVLGRELRTSAELTRAEATKVLDALTMAQHAPDTDAFMASWRRQAGLVVDEPLWDEPPL